MSTIQRMWDEGRVNEDWLVSQQGSTTWEPLPNHVIPSKPRKARKEASGGSCLGSMMKSLIIVSVGLVLVVILMRSMPDSDPKSSMGLELEARSWVRRHLADPDAEVTGVTSVAKLGGIEYFAAQVRGKNAFGGPISVVYILQVNGRTLEGYRPSEMRKLVNYQKGKLDEAGANRLEAQYQSMCRTFGIDPEK